MAIVGGVRIEVTIGSNIAVGGGLNVWHGKVADPPTAAEAQVLVDKLRDFYTAILGHIPNGTQIVVGARVLDLSRDPNILLSCTPRSVVGTAVGDVLPLQTALVLALKSLGLSRRQQGRVFLPTITEADNLPTGLPSGGLSSAVQTAANALVNTPIADAVPYIGIHSRLDNEIYALYVPVARTGWSTIRRRRG